MDRDYEAGRIRKRIHKHLDRHPEIDPRLYFALTQGLIMLEHWRKGELNELREAMGRYHKQIAGQKNGVKYHYYPINKKTTLYFITVYMHDLDTPKTGLWCNQLCGCNYTRPHFSCLSGKCYLKRIWNGMIPPIHEVRAVSWIVRKRRPYWKKKLTRYASTLYEWFIT